MERELFICSCENTEHQIVFSWFEDDDVANVYATIHLRKKSFWTRLKYGLKYIFGYQCKYGAFDEFIFNPDDAERLDKVVRWLRSGEKEIIPVTTRQEELVQAGRKEYPKWEEAQCHFIDGAHYADAHPHWISVEDEYPKEEQLVLACNTKGFFMPAKYSDGIWWFYWNLKSQLLDVVYWMPMPTLPNDYLAEASKEAHRIILEKQPKGGEK